MSRYIGSKAKICKRVGANLFGSPKFDSILADYSSKKKITKKPSEYSVQLKEKQLARYMFGLSERQFERVFQKASRSTGVTGMELLRLLERRIDNVLFRSGLASSRFQARQMVSHGHFELNGQRISIPSTLVRQGDVLTLRKRMQISPLYVAFDKVEPVGWIKLDSKKKEIIIDRIPGDDELEKTIKVQLIVEYYSR